MGDFSKPVTFYVFMSCYQQGFELAKLRQASARAKTDVGINFSVAKTCPWSVRSEPPARSGFKISPARSRFAQSPTRSRFAPSPVRSTFALAPWKSRFVRPPARSEFAPPPARLELGTAPAGS